MNGVDLAIPTLGTMFIDDRQRCPGNSYTWGPQIQADKVKYFAFHHSVTAQTAKNDGNWQAEVDTICNEHIAQGWEGCGYRFIIASSGHVLYVGDLSHGGSAVAGNNDIIFSACLVGDFTKELPTAYQIDSANKLMRWFLNNMPQYPLINSLDSVIGHQDAFALLHLNGATPTACPGPQWRNANDSLRDRIINNHYQGYPDPQPLGNLPPVTPPSPAIIPPVVVVPPEPQKPVIDDSSELQNKLIALHSVIYDKWSILPLPKQYFWVTQLHRLKYIFEKT